MLKQNKHIRKAVADVMANFNMDVPSDPYQIYKNLENVKNDIPDRLQYLAIQEHCLCLICADLADHGSSHISHYANGMHTEAEFNALHSQVLSELIDEMRTTDSSDAAIWNAFGKIPLRISEKLVGR